MSKRKHPEELTEGVVLGRKRPNKTVLREIERQAVLFVFAHGAGAGSMHPWMQRWQRALSQIGDVFTFDYDYIKRGSKAPDAAPKLIKRHCAAIREGQTAFPHSAAHTFLIGKSMGSRIGLHAAIELHQADNPICGCITLGYPLKAPNGQIRREVLDQFPSTLPLLMIQGERDSFSPNGLLQEVTKDLQCLVEVHSIPAGDHSLACTKSYLKQSGKTQEQVEAAILKEMIYPFVLKQLEKNVNHDNANDKHR